MVDPGRYNAYHCDALIGQWKALLARELELRNLQAKASGGGGGAMIGTIAYRDDYDAVLTDKKIVQRVAIEKNCELTPNYQSDQTIR